MNNIEILEEFLEQYNASYPEEKEWVAIYPNQIEAIENLIQENKELKDTLKQTQDSWYEDTKKIELNKEYEIALNNRILDLEQENKELKEKLQQYKKIEEIVNTITDDDIRNAIKNAEKDYIPKSKVKEKIEELFNEMDELDEEEFDEDIINDKRNLQDTIIVLKELLKEGE